MSNQSSTFETLIAAIVEDFETVGFKKTNNHTRPAYFEHLGNKHGLSAQALEGVWQEWLRRRKSGTGMFDFSVG